ncbi:uncharacterized protein [Haliotis cracherodii]|uniref:uncharacterized protein n=1 Tax=Haliotis cracherodii TaxID=6455 RepID=UPI0039E8D681
MKTANTMDTVPENNENVWKKKSSSRRSSILKLDRPTLADLDVNKKTETKLSRRSSKRVSFAETYQVKEFPKDSPQRWLRDLQTDISSGNESLTEDKSSGSGQTPTGHEILGLEQLLNGQIQTQGQEEDAQGINKTVLDGADMEETMCANTTIAQNTTLSNPKYDEDSDVEDKKVDTLSFLTKLMKAPKSCDNEPLIKALEDSDDEEYKASSFFRGGKGGFFSNNVDSDDEEEPVGKIDNKAFLSKLKSITTMSKQFAHEEEKRKEKENRTVIFDGLDDDMEVTANFTGMLQSIKKRQSTGNVLESTRIFAENDDGMEMTTNLTCNLEVVKSNLPISELNATKGQVSQISQSKLGAGTSMGRSTNHGLEETKVFTDYEDPTTHMDFTVAGGEILSGTHSAAAGTEGAGPQEGGDRTASSVQGTATPKHAIVAAGKASSPSEVTIRFGHQEIDADMEMTEALDPKLIISSNGGGTTIVKKAPDLLSRSHKRALTDVTADFGADGLKTRRDEGRRRIPSISPVDMEKENITVHFKTADTQGDMDFTSCLTTQVERQDKEGVVCQEHPTTSVCLEKTQIFGASGDVGNMEFTACLETIETANNVRQNVITHIDDTVSFKQKVPLPDGTGKAEGRVAVSSSTCQDVTRVFGKEDMTAAMELTGCQGMLSVKQQQQPDITCSEKTRVFNTEDMTAAMELTGCHGVLSVKQQNPDITCSEKTRVFNTEDVTAAMELTGCHGVLSVKQQNPDITCSEKTRVFNTEDGTAAMELTECVSAKVKRESSEGKTDDKTIHFERRGGSMELTSCQPGVMSATQGDVQSDTTRMFGATDVTAAMEMTECVSAVSTATAAATDQDDVQESKDKDSTKAEVTEDGREARRGERGRSLPGESMPSDKSLQQRRSQYSGMVNAAPPQVDGFSTQSLKRKLYSFDMMMAGAKAKTVKVAKLNKEENCGDKATEICSDNNTKVGQSHEREPQIPSTDSAPSSTKTGDMSGKDMPKPSPVGTTVDQADLTHTATDILKLGVPEGELSALEMLKMAALEEDTDMLDDTKLLELHMMAKNTKHKPNTDSLSQKGQADDGHVRAEKTILEEEEEDTKSQTIDSEEPPALLLDEDMNLTQHNTTTGLALILDKMNKSRVLTQGTSPVSGKTPAKERTTVAVGKHGSPEPISSADKKRPKLEVEDPTEVTQVDSQPADILPISDNDTVTSLDSANSESSEEHTRGHHSQSAISLSQSLLSFSLLDKKYDENDGPWDFGTFCERTGISQFKPKCNRRSSINILPALEADSLQEVLRLQTLTATETQVKDDMYERLQQQIERDEEEVEGQQHIVSEKEPMLFSQLRNSQITKEEVHSCYKACQRWAKAKMKRERVAISKQCLHNLKEEKERLCIGVNEVVTQAERVISDLASIDNLLADIDSQLEDLGEEPAVTEMEAEEVARLKEHLLIQTQELRKSEEEKALALRQQSELRQRQSALEAEGQRQELQMLEGTHTAAADGVDELDRLQHRLGALHRVLEWRVKERSPARDVFLFLYGGVEMSVTYDVVQHKTVDSVVLTTHLADSSSPWSHLAGRLIVDGVDCVRLRDRYSSRDKLPQMLNEISRLTAGARNLATQISDADLRHKVAINDYCVSVSFLNTRRVRKVVITFLLELSTSSCKPVDCSVDVVIGTITKETIADVIKETIGGPEFLTKSISRVQTLLDS